MELLKDGVVAADKPLILVVMEERSSSNSAAANSLVAASTRNLTPAENEVLSGLMRGHTAKLIARARGASVNTVRSQITTILEKTGHHTQKELIASFGSSTFGASSFGFDGFSVSRPSSMARAGGQTATATAARR
jgi:DNA-binding CsgD family transcriptional regulator